MDNKCRFTLQPRNERGIEYIKKYIDTLTKIIRNIPENETPNLIIEDLEENFKLWDWCINTKKYGKNFFGHKVETDNYFAYINSVENPNYIVNFSQKINGEIEDTTKLLFANLVEVITDHDSGKKSHIFRLLPFEWDIHPYVDLRLNFNIKYTFEND